MAIGSFVFFVVTMVKVDKMAEQAHAQVKQQLSESFLSGKTAVYGEPALENQ